ncbi:MAG: NAD(P)-dependent oxidoreductase [Acidimicrobiales bacterium]
MRRPQTVVITGAAGKLGTYLRSSLGDIATSARLVDIVRPAVPGPGEPVEVYQGSVTDAALLEHVCKGADAVVHLGGFAGDASWPDLSEVNIDGTLEVLEAARRNGVARVVVASSNHAVGFHIRGAEPLADDVAPRPDSLYGVSKAAGEALCQFYSVKFSMNIVCLRIGSCFDLPESRRMLSTWLSPGDFVRLVRASLETSPPGFRLVWGVSANTRRWWSTAGGEAIGFHPQDNAESFAELYPGNAPEPEYVGGVPI